MPKLTKTTLTTDPNMERALINIGVMLTVALYFRQTRREFVPVAYL